MGMVWIFLQYFFPGVQNWHCGVIVHPLCSYGVWCCITGWLMSIILRQLRCLIFKGIKKCLLRTFATRYPVTWHHIPEEWRLQLHHHENIKLAYFSW
jgi:hypothetical protein